MYEIIKVCISMFSAHLLLNECYCCVWCLRPHIMHVWPPNPPLVFSAQLVASEALFLVCQHKHLHPETSPINTVLFGKPSLKRSAQGARVTAKWYGPGAVSQKESKLPTAAWSLFSCLLLCFQALGTWKTNQRLCHKP